MKMIDTETGHEMVEVSGHDKKEYASKGVAGTGLGLGIAGTALWLLNKDVTIWDVYVALNAQYHDNINLYEKWFPNATNNEIEDKIVEATISNWFEDEDASSDKVWEYFRVI